MDWDVTSVTAIGDNRIEVSFRDGVHGEVIFERTYFRGVFSALADPEFFRLVHLDDAVVTWPGELDIAPDALHASLIAAGESARVVLT